MSEQSEQTRRRITDRAREVKDRRRPLADQAAEAAVQLPDAATANGLLPGEAARSGPAGAVTAPASPAVAGHTLQSLSILPQTESAAGPETAARGEGAELSGWIYRALEATAGHDAAETPAPAGGEVATLQREATAVAAKDTEKAGEDHETEAKAGPAEGWDADPKGLLGDANVNSEFKKAAQDALAAAVQDGLRPRAHEVYRSAERSDELYQKYKAGTGGRAAPGWASLHNYGLAMDVYLHDAKGGVIDTGTKGWYKEYKKLAAHMKAHQLEWGEPINDSDHFEYHPAWPGLVGGDALTEARDWALKTAHAENAPDWLPYFWWKAGAGGTAPSAAAPKDK